MRPSARGTESQSFDPVAKGMQKLAREPKGDGVINAGRLEGGLEGGDGRLDLLGSDLSALVVFEGARACQ